MDISEEDNSTEEKIKFKGSAQLGIREAKGHLGITSMTPREDDPTRHVKPTIPKLLLKNILTPLTDNEKVLSGDDAGENSENSSG